MLRIFLLIVFIAVGMIVAIPLKRVYDTLLGTAWPTGWLSNYELALLSLVPITFLIFVVFVGPARRVLGGGTPWGEKKKEDEEEETGIIGKIRRWRE